MTQTKIDDRTPPDVLVEDISPQFSAYIGQGISLDSPLSQIDPNLNIVDIDNILDLHFLLTGTRISADTHRRPNSLEVGVMDFVSLLERRLRRIRTTTQRETRTYHGEVRGRINWSQTIKQRNREGNPDSLQYACEITEEAITTEENLVLAKLLGNLRDGLKASDSILDESENPDWFEDWNEDSVLRKHLTNSKNHVYLSEIDIESQDVTDRMIRNVSNSRKELYREASQLLRRYRRIQNYQIDNDEAKELLRQNFFYPTGEHDESKADRVLGTFFELYWIFRFLQEYGSPRLRQTTLSTKEIAEWEQDESTYEMYHDWNGGEELSFNEPLFDRETPDQLPDTDHRYLSRLNQLLTVTQQETKSVFGRERPAKPSPKRPDLVILRRDAQTQDITDILIGEVKYTRKTGTATDGLEQLLQYMIYARRQTDPSDVGRYFTSGPNHYDTPNVHGVLCIDKHDYTPPSIPGVSVYEYGDEPQTPF